MDPTDTEAELRNLEAALDAAVEENRQMALELRRLDRVAAAAGRVAEAWREGRLTDEHVAQLERALKDLVN